MPILRDVLTPTVLSNVIATGKKTSMLNPQFGGQQQDPNQQQDQNTEEEPNTKDYIIAGLQKMAGRAAPPELSPGSRVRNADMSLAQPDNFKGFYDMLGSISQRGQSMTAAAEAKAAYARAQAAANISGQYGGGGGGSSSGGGAVGKIPSNPRANFRFAQQTAPKYGWGDSELAAWYTLGMKESGWNNNAQNPTSTAYGIGQFLNSTWGGYGIPKTSDPALQVEAMARYIKARYGSPSRALAFHLSHNWY